MAFTKIVTALLSLIALLTGAMDVIVGIAGQANVGAGLAASPPIDAVLDSQVRFLGAIWLGFGSIMLICLRDIHRDGPIIQTCFGVLVLGGFGRVASLVIHGAPANMTGSIFVGVALMIELFLVPAVWITLRRALKQHP